MLITAFAGRGGLPKRSGC